MLAISQQIFYINSKDRIGGTSSNFTYDLKMDKENKYSHVMVLDVSIPKSYYLIPAGANTFSLQEGKTTVTVTMPAANYNIGNLKTVLAAQLTLVSPNAATYTVTYPSASQPDTGKLTFTSTYLGATSFIFPESTIANVLGFSPGLTYNFTVSGGSSTLISGMIDLQNEQTLYIHSTMVTSPSGDNILQECFATDTPSYGRIVWQCTCPELSSKLLASPGSVSSVFNFTLCDEDGNEMNLNGLDWQMTICVYQKSMLADFLIKFLKIHMLESMK